MQSFQLLFLLENKKKVADKNEPSRLYKCFPFFEQINQKLLLMQKMLPFSFFLFLYMATQAATPPAKEPLPNATEIRLPVGSTGNRISPAELATIRVKDNEVSRGRKLSFLDTMPGACPYRYLPVLFQTGITSFLPAFSATRTFHPADGRLP
jgi:hypothetical protein